MGGGLLQLVANGTQDIFLTGNPQITFFKVVYKRHTNFSKECISLEIPKTIDTNSNTECEITLPRNGDLIKEMYIKLDTKTIQTQLSGNLIGKIQLEGIGGEAQPWFQFFDSNSSNINFNIGDRFKVNNNNIEWNSTVVLAKDNVYEVKNPSPLRANIFQLENITTAPTTKVDIPDYDTIYPIAPISSFNHTYTIVREPNDININFSRPKINISRDVHSIINNISISIGGQTIDKHYGEWFDIYNQLFENNIDYLNSMTMTNPIVDSTSTLYIPLRFWFNRNNGLALPLIALQYHEVKVHFNFNSTINSKVGYMNVINNSLLVNYIYLDTDERRKFAMTSHEYLIEQVQHTGAEEVSSKGHIEMTFNHPIKCLFWSTNYSNVLNNINIQLNGHDRFLKQSGNYFSKVQPYENKLGHKKVLDKNKRQWIKTVDKDSFQINSIQMYSFCLNPSEHQPSGSCNFSRIDNARLYYESSLSLNKKIYLFALNYNVLRIMSGMGGLTYSNYDNII